jgi:DNA-binding NtrC family response regulator
MSSTSAGRQATSNNTTAFPFVRYREIANHFGVVIVSADSRIGAAMTDILRECSLNSTLVRGLSELKNALPHTCPIACLCGFELADGSFREVLEFLERQPVQIPTIMVSGHSFGETPACILDSLKAGALATICYPYRLSDVQIMLWSAIQSQREPEQLPELEKVGVPA